MRVSRRGRAVILEQLTTDPESWFAEFDALAAGEFLGDGRSQPIPPERDIF